MKQDAQILHLVDEWLPLSQQFVDNTIRHSRYPATVLASRVLPNSPSADHLVNVASRLRPSMLRELDWLNTGWRTVRSVDARILHLHLGYAVHKADQLRLLTGLPLVISLHGHDITAFPRSHPRHYRKHLARAQSIVVPSHFLAHEAIRWGAPPNRIELICPGVDLAFFKPLSQSLEPTAVFIGRLVDKKGIDVLMRAWALVRVSVPMARLVVLGAGPMDFLVVGESVEPVRPDPRSSRVQVAELLRRARVVVTPSRTGRDGDSESCLLVNLEAMATGRAVVTTLHGGIPEFVVDGKTALVVPENDDAALASALIRALTDDELVQRLGSAGSLHVQSFGVDVCSRRLDRVYDGILHPANSKQPAARLVK